jgi:hypothetical protein
MHEPVEHDVADAQDPDGGKIHEADITLAFAAATPAVSEKNANTWLTPPKQACRRAAEMKDV